MYVVKYVGVCVAFDCEMFCLYVSVCVGLMFCYV